MMQARRTQSGLVALELALLAPVVVLMAVGVYSVTLAVPVKATLAEAVRAGAQWAGQGVSQVDDFSAVEAAVRANLGSVSTPVVVEIAQSCACPASPGPGLSTVDCGSGVCSGNGADIRPWSYLSITAQTPYALSWRAPGWPEFLTLEAGIKLRLD